MYPQSFATCTRNEVRWTHLVFSKKHISRFHIWNFESHLSLAKKVNFFQLPWHKQDFQEPQTSVYNNVVLLINFPEQFELFFTSNNREVIKFYNLSDKTFETDFNTDIYIHKFLQFIRVNLHGINFDVKLFFAIYQGKFAWCKLWCKAVLNYILELP